MHRNVFRQLLLLTLALVTLTLTATAQREPGPFDKVLGRWDLTVQGTDGPYPSWMEIRLRKETELMGSFVGRFGSLRYATKVEYKDGELAFQVPVQYEMTTNDLVFHGRLNGDKLEGTTVDEKGATINWTAVRAPEMKRTASPQWGKPVNLFNGKDLTGWKLRNDTKGNCWSVTNGAMTNNVPCVDIMTEQKFTDFKLHVEFNIVPESNSGIYLRGRHEVQINDDLGRERDSLRMGGLYGFIRPEVNASGKPGEWQTYDITLIGRRVTVVLNGQTIIDNAVIPGITGGAINSDEAAPGPILLQGDHGRVSFRKITITPAK
ncbi:MAG: DUF1080 domain-containing protein [Blastocatellia bacterium]